ncbi:pLS20_p028 family conjugation system transmembrane protein, partial [Metabacillus fastidiosus]|uniref:pLS20_p028 family conjugation system transmembrane protein n=1 Tax=Metabacillus fastidiosus TaxID=1458 RepID=UPI003D28F078
MLASNSEEILKILEMFKDFLSLGNFWNYSMRWLGWFLIQGISLLVDGLESVTDTILGTKTFFASQGVQDFVATIQPYLYILLALSFLYVGYMMIFNKKINREQIAINVFISIAVLFLLSPGMVKVDKFTDEAIKVVKDTGEGTLSQKIVKENLTDVSLFVENNFSSTELEESNRIPEEKIMKVDITEKVDEDFKLAGDKKIEDKAKQVLTNKSDMNNHGEETLVKLKDGWFDFFPQKYYRWHWNFWTITITLCMMGFTLLLVSIKIAKLSFELTFNYILAIIIAPADISTGQKLKEVLKSILNAFAVIIMIFISLKVYMLGTTYIAENLSGVAYLISLIAFSIVVIKGPSMVERVFGISGGSQDSIPVLTGAANTAVTTANLAKRGASKLGSGAVTAGAGIAGFASGFKAGGKNPNEMNSEMKNQQDEGKKQKNSLSDQSRDKDKDINGNDKKDLSLQDQMQGQQEEKKSNPEGAQTLEQQMKESGFKGNSQPSKFAQSEQNGNQVSNVPLTSINEGNPSHQDNERLEGVSQQDMDSPFANVSPAGEAKGDVTNT